MKWKTNTFACFSPPIMLATFIIEMLLAVYVLVRWKRSIVTKLVTLLLICLATFQLMEYGICEGGPLGVRTLAIIGFIAITMLPPLGLHLLLHLNGTAKKSVSHVVAYAAAVAWSAYFIATSTPSDAVCAGNYVIFKMPDVQESLYYLYYNAFLLIAVFIAWRTGRSSQNKTKKSLMHWFIAGYASFTLPAYLFALIDSYQGQNSQLPSVMCGFALIFAIILVLRITPLYHQLEQPKK